jgi:type IV secretion system protein VirB1
MIELALIMACAPNVAPSTIKEIVRVESGYNPVALNVNKRNGIGYPLPKKIKSTREAVRASHAAIAAGHTVDMGYMQINSSNLKKLGYTVEDMFDPCKNLAAGAKILENAYLEALRKYGNQQAALRAALSIYNTGDHRRGFSNGYVARYLDMPATPASSPYKADTSVYARWPARVIHE